MRLDFSFFAVVAVFLLLDGSGSGMAALCACFAHELAHFAAMAALNVPAASVTLYGAGMRISSPAADNARPLAAAVIYAAGCLTNLVFAAAFAVSGNHTAAAINAYVGAFNLLPIGELDGARLLRLAALKLCRPEQVDAVMRAAGVAATILCAAAALALRNAASLSLIASALYFIIAGALTGR